MTKVIVGRYFQDDDDSKTAWKQHEVYGQSLDIIISTCNRYALFARSLLNSADNPDWGTVRRYDHRVLQDAHDLLAAAWRFRNDRRQAMLPLEKNSDDNAQSLWLNWLREEIAEWITLPHLVRSVQLILTNQNKPVGYQAESKLCLGIVDRFSDVPWDPEFRQAIQSDLISG